MATASQQDDKASDAKGTPTLLEKLDLVPAFLSVIGTVCWRVLAGPFRGENGTDTYKHNITNAAMRKVNGNYHIYLKDTKRLVQLNQRLTTPQFQYIAPNMRSEYEKWCKANSQTPNVIRLASGAEAYWLGSSTAKNVVLYYHGGGFSLGAGMDHFTFWGEDVMAHVNAESPDTISFLFLSYTLVPYATYPAQPREAVEALLYLLEDMKRAPSSISLGGDSSGGNLCLAVLSHILHPTSDLPPLRLDGSLKTMLLLSPWVSFRVDFPSCTANSDRDITAPKAEAMWSSTYMAEAASTPYAEPLEADSDWWKGAEKVIEHVICTAGTHEIALDAVDQWVDKYRLATPQNHLEYVVGHSEVHIAPVIRLLFKDPKPAEQGEAIKAFLLARL